MIMSESNGKDIRIVVLQRGWVVVGHYWREGHYCGITGGACVRRWGTNRGLGQLAVAGPRPETELDPEPPSEWHALAEVRSIKCNADSWQGTAQEWMDRHAK